MEINKSVCDIPLYYNATHMSSIALLLLPCMLFKDPAFSRDIKRNFGDAIVAFPSAILFHTVCMRVQHVKSGINCTAACLRQVDGESLLIELAISAPPSIGMAH